MEEQANCGRPRDGCFPELLRGDGADELVELRAGLGVVVDGELARQAAGGGIGGSGVG